MLIMHHRCRTEARSTRDYIFCLCSDMQHATWQRNNFDCWFWTLLRLLRCSLQNSSFLASRVDALLHGVIAFSWLLRVSESRSYIQIIIVSKSLQLTIDAFSKSCIHNINVILVLVQIVMTLHISKYETPIYDGVNSHVLVGALYENQTVL